MWMPSIGENAGKIWQTLNEHSSLNLTGIRKITGLDDRSFYMALGWLAREDKITIQKSKGQTVIRLSGR